MSKNTLSSKIPREVLASRLKVSASVSDSLLAARLVEELDQFPERPSPLSEGQRQKIQLVRGMKAAALEDAVVMAWEKKPTSVRIGETFYKNYGWAGGVDEFSLVSNCELTLAAFERLKASGAITTIPPAEVEVLRPITKFRNNDIALTQIAVDVAGVWTTRTVKEAIGTNPKKAIKKTTILAILHIAVVLRYLLAKNQPVTAALIEKIIALCSDDLNLSQAEILSINNEDVVELGESPIPAPKTPTMPQPEIVKTDGNTPVAASNPTKPAATIILTEPAEPPAAVPAASAPAVQTDLGLNDGKCDSSSQTPQPNKGAQLTWHFPNSKKRAKGVITENEIGILITGAQGCTKMSVKKTFKEANFIQKTGKHLWMKPRGTLSRDSAASQLGDVMRTILEVA